MEKNKNPYLELHRLEFLIGKWNTEGEIKATAAAPAKKIKGTDTYEWVANGRFILHTVSVMMGDESVENVEMIGFDPEFCKYPMFAFDNGANISIMHGEFDDEGNFTITGETTRAQITANLQATELVGQWQIFQDGNWKEWMEVQLTK